MNAILVIILPWRTDALGDSGLGFGRLDAGTAG